MGQEILYLSNNKISTHYLRIIISSGRAPGEVFWSFIYTKIHCNKSSSASSGQYCNSRRCFQVLWKLLEISTYFDLLLSSIFPQVLELIRLRPNICKSLHLPAQSGNSSVLERMRRGYSRETYLELVEHIREFIPSVAFSSDFICGFCGETDEEFEDTLSLMKIVGYSTAYLFPYSMREKTTAHRRYTDDVPPQVKQLRLEKMINQFRNQVETINKSQIGCKQLVLVEGVSKRSTQNLMGRNDSNIKVIFPNTDLPNLTNPNYQERIKPGDYIVVKINAATSQVLKGIPLYHTTLLDFHKNNSLCL